jgi:hypothetical protein
MAQDAAMKKEQQRQAAMNNALGELNKVKQAHLIYQPDFSEKFKEGFNSLVSDFEQGKGATEIYGNAVNITQGLLEYAEGSKQIGAIIDGYDAANKAAGGIYNVSKLKERGISVLAGEDGKLLPPSKVNPLDLEIDEAIYSDPNGAGAQYLDKGAVVRELLKTDLMKHTITNYNSNELVKDGSPAGTFGIETTKIRSKSRPFVINSVTGGAEVKPEIMKAEDLVESGVLQAALDYRPFAALVEFEVSKNYAPETAPDDVFIPGVVGGTQKVGIPKKSQVSESELNFMRAEAARALLAGQEFGGTEFTESRTRRFQNRPVAGGGKLSAGEKKEQATKVGYDRFQQDILSGDISRMQQAVAWENKRLGLSDESRASYHDAIGAPSEWEFLDLTADKPKEDAGVATLLMGKMRSKTAQLTGGIVASDATPSSDVIYARFKIGTDKYEYVPVDVNKLTGQYGFQYYKETADRFGNYGQGENGVDFQVPAQAPSSDEPIFVNPKSKK